MIKIVVARRIYIEDTGWRIDPKVPTFRLGEIRNAGYLIGEAYVDKNSNSLYVIVDNEAEAAMFKLTYL